MLVPRDFTTIKAGGRPIIDRLLQNFVEPETNKDAEPDVVGHLGGTPVKVHDRKAFVVNEFEMGVLYVALSSIFDLDTAAMARKEKVVGRIWNMPVELTISSLG